MKSLLFILSICFALSSPAQQKLVFTNVDSSKTVIVKQKDAVRLAFNGYMNQLQEAEGIVSSINDSTITLSPKKKSIPPHTVLIKDITGFRRYSKFRPAGKIIYAIAGVGITGTATAIVSNANLSPALGFASAAGTAAVTTGLRNAFFPSKVKNYLNNGWTMKLLPDLQ
jgi:hypothetical protein